MIKSTPFWIWLVSAAAAVGGIACGVFTGLILGNNSNNSGNVTPTPDPTPTPTPDPDPEPEPDPESEWTEVSAGTASSWNYNHYQGHSAGVNATFSFDFSDTSSSDWNNAKNNIPSDNNGARSALLKGFINADPTAWNWSDASSKQTSSIDKSDFQSYTTDFSWSELISGNDSRYGSFSTKRYYLNDDESVLRFVLCDNTYCITSGSRTTYLYFSSNRGDLIKFVNEFKSFVYPTGNISNFNGKVTAEFKEYLR